MDDAMYGLPSVRRKKVLSRKRTLKLGKSTLRSPFCGLNSCEYYYSREPSPFVFVAENEYHSCTIWYVSEWRVLDDSIAGCGIARVEVTGILRFSGVILWILFLLRFHLEDLNGHRHL